MGQELAKLDAETVSDADRIKDYIENACTPQFEEALRKDAIRTDFFLVHGRWPLPDEAT